VGEGNVTCSNPNSTVNVINEESCQTRAQPPVSQVPPSKQPKRRTTQPEKIKLTPNQILGKVLRCTVDEDMGCYKKRFESRREAHDHLKDAHNMKMCPVCFKSFSRHETDWKDHILETHMVPVDVNPHEMVHCPVCQALVEHEGMYQHISRTHLLQEEKKKRRQSTSSLEEKNRHKEKDRGQKSRKVSGGSEVLADRNNSSERGSQRNKKSTREDSNRPGQTISTQVESRPLKDLNKGSRKSTEKDSPSANDSNRHKKSSKEDSSAKKDSSERRKSREEDSRTKNNSSKRRTSTEEDSRATRDSSERRKSREEDSRTKNNSSKRRKSTEEDSRRKKDSSRRRKSTEENSRSTTDSNSNKRRKSTEEDSFATKSKDKGSNSKSNKGQDSDSRRKTGNENENPKKTTKETSKRDDSHKSKNKGENKDNSSTSSRHVFFDSNRNTEHVFETDQPSSSRNLQQEELRKKEKFRKNADTVVLHRRNSTECQTPSSDFRKNSLDASSSSETFVDYSIAPVQNIQIQKAVVRKTKLLTDPARPKTRKEMRASYSVRSSPVKKKSGGTLNNSGLEPLELSLTEFRSRLQTVREELENGKILMEGSSLVTKKKQKSDTWHACQMAFTKCRKMMETAVNIGITSDGNQLKEEGRKLREEVVACESLLEEKFNDQVCG